MESYDIIKINDIYINSLINKEIKNLIIKENTFVCGAKFVKYKINILYGVVLYIHFNIIHHFNIINIFR